MSAAVQLIKKLYNKRQTEKKRKSIINSNHSVFLLNSNIMDFRKQGFSLVESKLYSLIKGGKNNYKDYITTWESYQPRLGNNKYFCISDDKYLFSLVFQNYIRTPKTICLIQKGKIISLGKDVYDIDSLIAWIYRNNGCVIKDRSGSDGFDVFVISIENNNILYRNKILTASDLANIIEKLPNGIIQERVFQGEYASKLYSGSVNTLRIVSIRKVGEIKHEIVGAVQRIGTNASAPVDNFRQGGLCALIDLESGVLGKASGGVLLDSNGNRILYSKHPDSGGQIEGVVVPNWKEIKKKIIEITEQLPFFEYIAWDIVVQDNGISVIETNMKSDLAIFQIHGGLRHSKLGEAYREHGWLVDEKKL